MVGQCVKTQALTQTPLLLVLVPVTGEFAIVERVPEVLLSGSGRKVFSLLLVSNKAYHGKAPKAAVLGSFPACIMFVCASVFSILQCMAA